MVASNARVATQDYAAAIRTAVEAGGDAGVSGAGLPLDLPGLESAQAIQPGQTTTGFTMQLGSVAPTPSDSTQQFMSAYNAVRPHTAQPQPAQPAAPQPAPVQIHGTTGAPCR